MVTAHAPSLPCVEAELLLADCGDTQCLLLYRTGPRIRVPLLLPDWKHLSTVSRTLTLPHFLTHSLSSAWVTTPLRDGICGRCERKRLHVDSRTTKLGRGTMMALQGGA